uniref:Reverse transcriptase domain-containing protein n=1 Tax=Timema poppense TaxID=170557 RepID=A0A7R9DE68_TIMPO|nr:unnamed protein product [Timema poppensis]
MVHFTSDNGSNENYDKIVNQPALRLPVLFSDKGNKESRLAVDYQKLNIIKYEATSIKTIEMALQYLRKAKVHTEELNTLEEVKESLKTEVQYFDTCPSIKGFTTDGLYSEMNSKVETELHLAPLSSEMIMSKFQTPKKMIVLTKLCLHGPEAAVLSGGEISGKFEVRTGLRQRDALSPPLFNFLALEWVIRHTENPQWKDDDAMMSQDKEELKKITEAVKQQAAKVGLHLNEDKTEYMLIPRREQDQDPLSSGGISFGSGIR